MDDDVWQAEAQFQELQNGKFAAKLSLERHDGSGVSVCSVDLQGEYDSADEALAAAESEIKKGSPFSAGDAG